jgi:hypothetical protein
MRFAVLLHRAREHRLDVTLEQAGERTWFLVTKTTRSMRRLRCRMLRVVLRETRLGTPTAQSLGAAAGLLDDDLVADPPAHRFEKGHR